MTPTRFTVSRRRFVAHLAPAAALSALAGCMPPPPRPPAWWAPFVTVDPALTRRGLRELDFTLSRNAGGFARLSGSFVNRSGRRLSAAWRVLWLDGAGQPVDSIGAGWRVVHALPGASGFLAATAPRDDIDDFRVEMIPAGRLGAGAAKPGHTG